MKILYITSNYLPDKIGGTEIYVHGLSKELILRGHKVFITHMGRFHEINGPSLRCREYVFEDTPVFVIERNDVNFRTAHLYFLTQEGVYKEFKRYLKDIMPDIVHFHQFSPTDIILQMEVVKAAGIPVVFTYHSPHVACSRADMLFAGVRPCDGEIINKRCLACSQTRFGIPYFLAKLWAGFSFRLAELIGRLVFDLNLNSPLATYLQLPWLSLERIKRWKKGFSLVDHYVAVCLWAYELLLKNGVSTEKISLSRQGIGRAPSVVKKHNKDVFRLGYIGRIHPVKGVDMLINAFKKLPIDYKIELCIYGMPEKDRVEEKYYQKLRYSSSGDKRIVWPGVLPTEERFDKLAQLDALVIPSRWLETGPLVLLESWAVGTPVIGTKLGGIAELVREGQGGLLFRPQDVNDLAAKIKYIYQDHGLLLRLKESIPHVRTMQDVACDMEVLYKKLKKE